MNNETEPGRSGPLFEDFLREQGTYEGTSERAVKRVLAFQLAAVMAEQKLTKIELARRLETSRSQLDRLLDPDNDGVTLAALARAAQAVGRSIKVELI